ncbi:hypothetical protein DM790_09285 [Flavobacterium collinsii]|nr:hypothetical protein [Flavobacterium collinsii]
MKLFWKVNLFISIVTFVLFTIPIVLDLTNRTIYFISDFSNLIYLLDPYFEMIQMPISFLIAIYNNKKIFWIFFLIMFILFVIKMGLFIYVLGSGL